MLNKTLIFTYKYRMQKYEEVPSILLNISCEKFFSYFRTGFLLAVPGMNSLFSAISAFQLGTTSSVCKELQYSSYSVISTGLQNQADRVQFFGCLHERSIIPLRECWPAVSHFTITDSVILQISDFQ